MGVLREVLGSPEWVWVPEGVWGAPGGDVGAAGGIAVGFFGCVVAWILGELGSRVPVKSLWGPQGGLGEVLGGFWEAFRLWGTLGFL